MTTTTIQRTLMGALTALLLMGSMATAAQELSQQVSQEVMQAVYDEVRTPYKYGMVVAPTDNYHKIDCPTVFREGDRWLMTYVCYDGKDGTDGRGYETWLASSDDLLHWTTLGRILALPPSDDAPVGAAATPSQHSLWDQNQRGGFPALIDHTWGGTYAMQPYRGRHYLTYIGGPGTGYEAVRAPLSIGMASTRGDITTAHQWDTTKKPLLSYDDKEAQWWEQMTQYKSTIYWLKDKDQRIAGEEQYPFVMFYNAGGKDATHPKGERIGIALSKDMRHWKRYHGNPVFAHDTDGTITGDAQIVRMSVFGGSPAEASPRSVFGGSPAETAPSPLWVMFYFSAYNPTRPYNAYNTFAVSRDLIHWQDWTGPDLITPSKPYDELFAHKSYVVKHDGVVYHFYCAVNNAGQRGIALATSARLGRSEVRFPAPEPTGKRIAQSLNDGWLCWSGCDTIATIAPTPSTVTLPHNIDDYYGYRQLRHGNLHGSAIYQKTFASEKRPGKRYFLQFEGVGTYATVTLNGHAFPRELVGRTVWTLDVTDALRSGDNQLQVRVDHPAMQTESPWVCGGCSSEWGFSEGSQPFGIFRPVTLIATDEVRIEPFGVHIWNNQACDSVFIETEIKNYSANPAYVELVNKLAEKSGKTVFRQTKDMVVMPGETKTVLQTAHVADAHRWTLTDPYLYTLTTMLKKPGRNDVKPLPSQQGAPAAASSAEPPLITTDDVRTPFGIRSLRWPRSACPRHCDSIAINKTDHRFYLNEQPVFINGTCEYEHILGASHAFSHEQIASRIKQIRHAGFNAFREAHQPHNLYYQQLLDEQGLLFWSQFSAHIWYDTPQFRENFKRLLVRWIKERRNSPSVILWGLQNESVLPREFAQECSDIIRSLDPTASSMRLITTCNGGEGTDWNVVQNWSGTYGGSADNYAEELARPDQLLNGEYGAWRTLDLHGPDKYSEESFTALLALKDSLARVAFSASNSAQQLPSQFPSEARLPVASQGEGSGVGSDSSGVCGHFQWIFASHDNPGRVQPDGALRRIDKIGPINYKGLTTIWEEPTQAYYGLLGKSFEGPESPDGPYGLSPNPSPKERGVQVTTNREVSNGKSNREVSSGRGNREVSSGRGNREVSSGRGNSAPLLGRGVGGEALRSHYLYRINCGGDTYTDEYGQTWQADDSIVSHSWGQDFPGIHPFQASQRHISADIRGTQSDELFQYFRFGRHRLWYDFPVPVPVPTPAAPLSPSSSSPSSSSSSRSFVGSGSPAATASSPSSPLFVGGGSPAATALYRIELYFLEPWHGKDDYSETADYEGLRIFDVAVNDSVVIDDLDPWAEAGYCGALKRVVYAAPKNGHLRISFPEVKAGQAVIAAIAIAAQVPQAPISLSEGDTIAPASQTIVAPSGAEGGASVTVPFWHALDTDTIARLPKAELPADAEARPATTYEPEKSRKGAPVTFVVTPGLGQEYALRFRYKNTSGKPAIARIKLVDSKNTVLVDRDITFPPTPDKWKMLSTTTGTQINAGTYRLTITGEDLQIKNLEMQ